MKLHNKILVRWAAFCAAWLIRHWLKTVHYRILSIDGSKHPPNVHDRRVIYAFWHESFIAPTFINTKVNVLISNHRDGEYAAQICEFLGYDVVRGSTNRGGTGAVMELVQLAEHSHMLVTPDGPRGPRRQIQPGLAFLASQTRLPVVVVGIGFTHAWRARSWDQFAIPWPGSTITAVISSAIHVPASLDRPGRQRMTTMIQEALDEATSAAESWAATGKKPVFRSTKAAA